VLFRSRPSLEYSRKFFAMTKAIDEPITRLRRSPGHDEDSESAIIGF